VICSKQTVFGLLLVLLISACHTPEPGSSQKSRAEMIIDSAVAYHGGSRYDSLELSFRFRDRIYDVSRQNGKYQYSVTYSDSNGIVKREIRNEGYAEFLNDLPITLSSKDSVSRAASVNSVIYFVLLPGPLQDPAVNAAFNGIQRLKDKEYYEIEVRFHEEGGGEDFEDVYLYWFDREDYSMDYLAYSFYEDDGGTRFREAYNTRRINDLILQDYLNFKGPSPDSLGQISELFRKKQLDTLSRIEVSSIHIQ
jgi:hypothetical protein